MTDIEKLAKAIERLAEAIEKQKPEQPQYIRYGRPSIYIDYRRLFEELDSKVDGPCTMALLAGKDSPPLEG